MNVRKDAIIGLGGFLSPFRPERIAQPGQGYPHRHRECPIERVRKLRKHEGRHGPDGKQTP